MSSALRTIPPARSFRRVVGAALGFAFSGCAVVGVQTPPAAVPPSKPTATAPQAAPPKPTPQPAPSASAAEAQVAESPATEPAPAVESGPRLTGFLRSELILRRVGGDQDFDQTNFFSVDYSDPRNPAIRAHVAGRLAIDLDGQQADNRFNGLSDVHGDAVDFKLYDAFVDVAQAGGAGRLRIGRQLEYEAPVVVHYDGLDLRVQPGDDEDFLAGLYGGIPVRLYTDRGESRSLIGLFAEDRPWKGGRARFDWMHVEDEQLAESGNGILALSLWQGWDNGWAAEGQYSRLEDDDRDLRLRTQWTSPDAGLSASATYYQLFATQDALPADIDPYTEVLMALFPYEQYGLTLTTELTEDAELDLAADIRRVSDSGDIGEFNRDWERYRAALLLREVFESHFDVSLFDDIWDGDDRDVSSWGLDVSYDTRQQWKFGAGTYYSLYKYDLLQQSERDDVRTWYARAAYQLSKAFAVEFSYDFEDDDEDSYNALRGGVMWNF